MTHSSQLNRQRKEFCNVAQQAVEIVNEQTTCHQAIAQAWNDLRVCILSLYNSLDVKLQFFSTVHMFALMCQYNIVKILV